MADHDSYSVDKVNSNILTFKSHNFIHETIILNISFHSIDSELSRSSPVSSRDSKKTKDKSKTPTKIIDLSAEVNFEAGFKMNQSSFLNEIKLQIDEYVSLNC